MKKVFIVFLCLVFIAAMTACKTTTVPAGTDNTPETVNTPETLSPVDTIDTNPPAETVQTAVAGGNYSLTLDVNPSIELTVQDGVVTGVSAYNDDGQAIVLSADAAGLSVNGAIDAIIAEIAGAGYLGATDNESYVLLTVSGGEENPELNEELKEYTEEALEKAGVDSEVETVSVSGDIVDGAAAQGMSAGRYMMLQYIANEKGITFEEAVALYGAMSMGELMEQVEDIDEAFDEDGENDIEDIEDEDSDEQGEDIEDQDDDDQGEDQDDDQNDDEDDDDQGEHGGGDDQGEDD